MPRALTRPGRTRAGALTITAIRRPPAFRRPPAVAVLTAVLLTAGCGGSGVDGDDASGGGPCGAVVQETLDPRSTQHLLPGADEPEYSSDPPTSGPHLAGGVPTAAQRRPVSRPAQVTVLESGGVMVQYKGLDSVGRRRVEALAAPDVVTAPNPDLPGVASRVVATAWRHRLTCPRAGEAEVDAIEFFIDARRGKGPAGG